MEAKGKGVKKSGSFLETFTKNIYRTKDKTKPTKRNAYSTAQLEDVYKNVNELQNLSEKEVNMRYELMLDDMNLSDEKKEPLLRLPLEQRRLMLANQVKGNIQQKTGGNLSLPSEYIVSLNSDIKGDKRFELITSLRVALTSNPVSWVKEFDVRGLNALLKNLTYCYDSKTERKSTLECVKCVAAFMNNAFGLMQIISHEEALTILARSADPRDPKTMFEAVQLLAATCLVPPDGHEKALEGITICGEIRGQDRFTPIVQGLFMKDPNMTVACLQLINAIVSTPEDLDFRLHLRNEFMRTGLQDALEELEKEDSSEVKTQVNIFLEHKEEDADEINHRYENIRLEIDDPKECFELLFNTTLNTQAEPYFLSILQHLIMIRDDYAARPQYFKLIEECVSQIVLHKSGVDPDFRHTKRFDIDVEPLIGKLSEDSLEEGGGLPASGSRHFKSKLEDALTAKQESEAKVSTLENKVKQYETELAELKEKYMSGRGAAIEDALNKGAGTGGGGPPPPPGGGAPPPPPPPLPGMGGPPPPPPLPGMGGGSGGPPPPPPLPGMGGGPPPPPPLFGKGPPGGPPPPPGMGMMMSPPTNQLPHGMKPKTKYNPEVQMKRMNWSKVNAKNLDKDAFWVKANEEAFANDIIFEGLKNNFGTKPREKSEPDQAKEEEAKKRKSKAKTLHVLDPKSSQNLSILLGSIKVPYDEIKRRILEMDEEKLSTQMIEQLIKFLPEQSQMTELAKLKDIYNELAESEQFAVTMSSIKRVGPRLKSMAFKMQFPEMVGDIKPEIVCATCGLEEIKNSDKFAKILQLILLMGNYMNSGSRNAQSVGFEISFLTKLNNTKSHDSSTTLTHFLAKTVEEKYPDLLNFSEELIHIEKAAKVSQETVQKNLKTMEKSLKQLEIDIKNAENNKSAPPNDKFVDVMSEWVVTATEQYEVMDTMYQKMITMYSETADYYSFDAKKYPMEEFFGDLKTFLTMFNTAHKENVTRRETEERIRKAKENKEKAMARKQQKKQAIVDITAEGDQEGVMDNLLAALKTGSAFNINREKKEGRKRTPRAAGAERRAQLQRSRSRQNIFQNSTLSPDIVKEINFEDTESPTPAKSSNRKAQHRNRGNRDKENIDIIMAGGDVKKPSNKPTEAEELLNRLKGL